MTTVTTLRKSMLTVFVFSFFTFLAAGTRDWKVSPEKIFVFELSDQQVEQLFRTQRQDTLIQSLLDVPVTWFPRAQQWQDKPEAGHFVYADIVRNKVYFRYAPAIPFQVFLFREHGALTLQVIDRQDRVRTDAEVFIREEDEVPLQVPYDPETQTYSIREDIIPSNRMLQVRLDGFTSFFDLRKNSVSRYFRNYHHSRQYTQPEQQVSFYRYMITDKNKYKPGETVRFKTYALDGQKRPLTNELSVWLQGFDGKYKYLHTLQPNHPGNYTGEISLHDSLELKLDRQYNIQLRDARSAVISSVSFKYEDYELMDLNLDVRMKTVTHYTPDNNEVIIHATDANGLTLPEAVADVTITCTGISEVFSDYVAMPVTLLRERVRLESTEATRVPVPAYLFGATNCSYQVHVSVETLDSQPLHRTQQVHFYHNHHDINWHLNGQNICFDFLELGKSKPMPATLQYNSGKESREIMLPYEEPFDPKHTSYYLYVPELGLRKEIKSSSFAPAFNLAGYFSEGGFHTTLQNPLGIDFSWYIYASDKLLRKGSGSELDVTIPQTDLDAVHYVKLHYRLGDTQEVYSGTYTPRKDYLDITTNLPDRIYPGQTWDATVQVKDIHGKPLQGVDLTAFAVNSLLNYHVADLPYYGPSPKPQTKKDDYQITGYDFSASLDVSWPYWRKHAGLDTMEYYHFIFPTGLFRRSEPAPDSITQFAPYVMKGGAAVKIYAIEWDREPIYFSWTHNIRGYSFPVTPDSVHQIRLRLHDCLLTIPYIQFPEGMKTTLSIDLDHLPADVSRRYMYRWDSNTPGEFSAEEKNRYQQYISRVPLSGTGFTYLKSDEQIHPVHYIQKSPVWMNNCLIGPYRPGPTSWMNGIEYRHEGGYRYAYEGNVIYKYYETDQFPVTLTAETDPEIRQLHEFHISVDSIFRTLEKRSENEIPVYHQPDYYYFRAAGLDLNLQLEQKEIPSPIAGVILYNRTDRSETPLLIDNPRHNQTVTADGMYDLILLYKNGTYLRAEQIALMPQHYISVNMKNLPVQAESKESAGWLKALHIAGLLPPDPELVVNRSRSRSPRGGQVIKTSNKSSNITGKIFDEYGEELIGANIVIIGTTQGAISDLDGEFALPFPAGSGGSCVLQISYIGYETVTVEVRQGTHLQITMADDTSFLDEVVVVGYGTQRKMAMTGSVATVKQEEAAPAAKAPEQQGEMVAEEVEAGEEQDDSPTAEDTLYEELLLLNGLRSNFSDVGFWQPVLYTDKKGEASFTITFPDNITRWNAVVYGMNRRLQTGTLRQPIRSWKPLMGELKTPQFLVAGDTAYAASTVRNYTNDKEINGRILYTLDGDTLQHTPVAFGGLWQQRMFMHAATPDSLTGRFLFTRDDGYEDGEERKIPVIPTGTEVADGALQILKNGEVIDLQAAAGEQFFVTLTTRPLEVYLEAVGYLLNYQYACNEQLASKLSGLMNHKMYVEYNGQKFPYDKEVKEIIAKLLRNQNDGQLWSWWGRNTETSVWMSAHILRSLKKAQDAGYEVPLHIAGVQHNYTDIHPDRRRGVWDIDILHALSLWDVNQDYERAVEWFEEEIREKEQAEKEQAEAYRKKKNTYYRRNSYLKQKLLLWEIRQRQGLYYSTDSVARYLHTDLLGTVSCDEADASLRTYSSRLENTIIAYRIVRNDPQLSDRKEAMQMYILGTKGRFWNTYHSANIVSTILPDLLADGARNDAQAKISFAGKENRDIMDFPYQTVLREGETLRIEKKEGLPVFCSWHTLKRKTQGYESDAFAIRSYFNREGTLQAGTPVTLHVEVEVKQDEVEYVMIEIPVPAGCSYASKGNYYYNEVHREYFKEKTVVFCRHLRKGTHTFQVELLPRFTGQYHLNPAKVELMYEPVINALNDIRKVGIGANRADD